MSSSPNKSPKYQSNERFSAHDLRLGDDYHAQDATRPDIVPAALRFSDDVAPVSSGFDRYWQADDPAYIGWPEVRLAYRETRGDVPRAVLLLRARRELWTAERGGRIPEVEAFLAERLQHPLVIPVLDLIAIDGAPLLVMEYTLGVTLSSLERQWSPLRPRLAVAVACDVLRALHAGHRATAPGTRSFAPVHGSLSPREILVGTDGRSRIVDFSLAEDTGRTLVERVDRNRGYLAPEQVFDRRLDARTDVFTMGAVLWECLTGYALLAGDDPVERLLKLMTVGCDPPSRFNAEITPELDAVVARALEPSPEHRFQSAGEFASALSAILRPASATDVAECVRSAAKANLEEQEAWLVRASEAPPSRTRGVLVARSSSERPRETATVRAVPARSTFRLFETRDEPTVPDRPFEALRPVLESEPPERLVTPLPSEARTPTLGAPRPARIVAPAPVPVPEPWTERRAPFFIVVGLVAVAGGFALSRPPAEPGPARAPETSVRAPSPSPSPSPPHAESEASAPRYRASPSAEAADGPDVPVVRVDDLPVSKADEPDSKPKERKSKRRPSVAPRRKPAR